MEMERHPDVHERFAELPERMDVETYNFEHFRPKHLIADIQRGVRNDGIQPGEVAPDFALPSATGETFRLSELRGQPVLLHFGSYT
jgi:hypothetical protein